MKRSQLMGREALPRPRPVRRRMVPAPGDATQTPYTAPAAAPAVTLHLREGYCRVCGCSELEPCDLGAGFMCWWVDAAHTLCSAPRCLAVVPLRELETAAGLEVSNG